MWRIVVIFSLLQSAATLTNDGDAIVTTIANITSPVGASAGIYRGDEGYFITTAIHALYFLSRASATGKPVLVAGLPYLSGSHDGPLLYSLFASPTRLVYNDDGQSERLYICESKNHIVRVVDLQAGAVSTMRFNSTALRFADGGSLYRLSSMDIAIYDNRLYVSTSSAVYEVVGSSGGLSDVVTAAIATPFSALATYFSELPSDTYITSIAPWKDTLYLSLSYGRNLLVSTELDPNSNKEVTYIAGNTSHSYAYPRLPPIATDGDAPDAVVAFPSHLRVDENYKKGRRLAKDESETVVLYFSEVYPATTDYSSSFGSLTVRQCIATTEGKSASASISTIAGAAPDSNTSEYQFIGAAGSYLDGPTTAAHFGFPISILVLDEEVVVCDYTSNALRLITTASALIPTPSPTAASTLESRNDSTGRSVHALVIWSSVSVALGLLFLAVLLCMNNRSNSDVDNSINGKQQLMRPHDNSSLSGLPQLPKSPASLSVVKLTAAAVKAKAGSGFAAGKNLFRRSPGENWREIPLTPSDSEAPASRSTGSDDTNSEASPPPAPTLWDRLKSFSAKPFLTVSRNKSCDESVDNMDASVDSNEYPPTRKWGYRDSSFEDVMGHETEEKWHSKAWDEDLDEDMVTAL